MAINLLQELGKFFLFYKHSVFFCQPQYAYEIAHCRLILHLQCADGLSIEGVNTLNAK